MAAPTVDVAAETQDYVPTSPPYRLSRVDGKDELIVSTTITFDGTLTFFQYRLGGTSRINGTWLGGLGIVAGVGVPCGTAKSLVLDSAESPYSPDDFSDADFEARLDAEDDYRVGVDALNNGGWSS